MMKAYLAFVSTDHNFAKIIKAVTGLNHSNQRKWSHIVLIYENKNEERFVIETTFTSIHLMNFESYSAKTNLDICYVELNNMFPDDNSFYEFQEFLAYKYITHLFSVSKTLKSIEIDVLNNQNFIGLFEDTKNSLSNSQQYNNIQILEIMLKRIHDQLKEKSLEHLYKDNLENVIDIFKKSVDKLLKLNDRELSNPNKKYFHCTEVILNIIKDWCRTKNISLPNIFENDIIFKKTDKIYPSKLFEYIVRQNKHTILNQI